MKIILITGMSGAGKSIALSALEDAHYHCIDNLLPQLLSDVVHALDGIPQLAVAIDARSALFLPALPASLDQLKQAGHHVRCLFLDASDHCLTQRFSETRRPHPLTQQDEHQQLALTDAITKERKLLIPLHDLGHRIDTSALRPSQLRQWINTWLGIEAGNMRLTLMSFGFKHGIPHEADFLFDVRNLPNPYYDSDLRPLSGRDAAVVAFLAQHLEVQQTIDDIVHYITPRIGSFVRDGRSYLTVAIGCTGGQHRSVYIVEQLAKALIDNQPLLLRHRDIDTHISEKKI